MRKIAGDDEIDIKSIKTGSGTGFMEGHYEDKKIHVMPPCPAEFGKSISGISIILKTSRGINAAEIILPGNCRDLGGCEPLSKDQASGMQNIKAAIYCLHRHEHAPVLTGAGHE